MRRFLSCITLLFLIPGLAYAQFDSHGFKKEAPAFEQAINGIADSLLPGYGVREQAKAAYIEGYGPVFFVEVALERAANPFFSPGSPTEVKRNMERRHKEIKEKIADLLKTKFSDLKAASDSGTVSVVMNVFNSNPAYAPDIPTQIVFTAKKHDTAIDVAIHEYNFDPSHK